MRFLCLHGMGTNSDVLRYQLQPIISSLESHHEFVFLDGTIECPPADGIGALFPPPYYCYYSQPTQSQLLAARDLVLDTIDDEGPFDGVFAFSQGAALVSAMMLHHLRTSGRADLFKFAVLTGASLPFDLHSGDEQDMIEGESDSDATPGTTPGSTPPPSRPQLKRTLSIPLPKAYNTIVDPLTGELDVVDWVPGSSRVEITPVNGYVHPPAEGEVPLRRYHASREPELRVRVPTVHVLGLGDPYLPQCRALVDLCDSMDRVEFEHGLGHEIPRDLGFGKEVGEAVERMIRRVVVG